MSGGGERAAVSSAMPPHSSREAPPTASYLIETHIKNADELQKLSDLSAAGFPEHCGVVFFFFFALYEAGKVSVRRTSEVGMYIFSEKLLLEYTRNLISFNYFN